MLKFVFWTLLALNALLFAYGRGYLGAASGNEHEPARMKNQLAVDKIKLLDASAAKTAPSAAPAPEPEKTEPAAPAEKLVACTEVGSFDSEAARKFERRLAKLELGKHQSRQGVTAQEVTSYIVYLPPQGSKEAADRKTAELREQGVQNSFILTADSPYKWGISLGVFKSEASAQTLLASLGKQGVQGVKIAPRGPQGTRYTYQFRDIDAATRTKIVGYADSFDAVKIKNCR